MTLQKYEQHRRTYYMKCKDCKYYHSLGGYNRSFACRKIENGLFLMQYCQENDFLHFEDIPLPDTSQVNFLTDLFLPPLADTPKRKFVLDRTSDPKAQWIATEYFNDLEDEQIDAMLASLDDET